MQHIQFYPAGDHAITLSVGDVIDEHLNTNVQLLYQHLRQYQKPYWQDIIPAYATITIVYDAAAILSFTFSAYDWVKREVEEILKSSSELKPGLQRKVVIPVCYEGDFAPDLTLVAKRHKLTPAEVIALHTQQHYRVYMLGFLPGFAYMGIVPNSIATPRLATPRTAIPAGSVGIAGNQTGIYPLESPGGWNIIGRTPVKLFEHHANTKDENHGILLRPGDVVKFQSISRKEFDHKASANFKVVNA